MSSLDYILKYALIQNSASFDFESFNNYLRQNSRFMNKAELFNLNKLTKGFVKTYKKDQTQVIELNQNPFTCRDYQSGKCSRENQCNFLHVCLNFMTSDKACKSTCNLNHNLQDDFNTRILAGRSLLHQFNLDLLIMFYKKFFKRNNASIENRGKENVCFSSNTKSDLNRFNNKSAINTNAINTNISNEDRSTNFKEKPKYSQFTQSKNQRNKQNNKRVIEIEYPKNLFANSNPSLSYILDIFNKLFNTTSNDIEDSKIFPDKNKVVVTYKRENIAKNILESKKINFFDIEFKINRVKEDIKFIKHFKGERFLNLVLTDYTKEFHDVMNSCENEIKINKNCLIITPKNTPQTNWLNNVNNKIRNFCSQYRLETINLTNWNQSKKNDLIQKIIIAELNCHLNKNTLDLVGRKEEVQEFMKIDFNVFDTKTPNSNSIKNISIDLPKSQLNGFNSLISLALTKLKLKYNLENYELNVKDSKITLYSYDSNLNLAIASLNHIFTSVKSKRIEYLSSSSILENSKNLNQLIECCIKQYSDLNDLIFKICINSSSNIDDSGVFLSYFYDCVDIDSAKDSVYDKITRYLELHFFQIKLDVTKNEAMLNSGKWRTFEQDNFSKAKCSNYFSYYLNKDSRNNTHIYLTGTFVKSAQEKIENFFKENQSTNSKYQLNQTEYIYVKKCSKDLRNYLESIGVEYELKEFDTLSKSSKKYFLILNECPNKLLVPIKNKLNEIILKKNVKKFQTEILPGDYTSSTQFRTDLDNIENEFNCSIDYKLIKELHNTNLNAPNKSVQIGTNMICLEIGSLINGKTDIIVNSTSSYLNLNTGVLSKMILEAAGPIIKDECVKYYPNGISSNEIAITSAGYLSNIKKIFHISPPHYTVFSVTYLEDIVGSCLKKMLELNMSSISFPSIGTGGFGYPVDFAAQKITKACIDFLNNNLAKNLLINIVLYDKDTSAIQAYEKEILKYQSEMNNNSFDFIKEAKNKSIIDFEIVYNTEGDYVKIVNKIQYLVSEKYIIRDLIEYNHKEIITNQEFDHHLKEFDDLEVKIKNDKINLFGPKEQVLNAKLKITNLITENLKNHYTKLENKIRLFKDIQWEYESEKNKWKPFSLFLNSQIETFYLKEEQELNFVNEDNINCVLDFKNKKLTFNEINKTVKVNRKDLKEKNILGSIFGAVFSSNENKFTVSGIQYPSEWNEMADSLDFGLFDVREASKEYLDVVMDFKSKMKNRSVIQIKVQRIQNKTAYEAYLTYKKRFKLKNKNENEMFLFHGTKGSAVDSICRFGFNRSYCGVNGVAYGQGVYFSNCSSYSHSYTDQFNSKIIRARVIVGDSILGNSQMKVPPLKLNGEPYDSTCDASKSIFVCYHDNQCYPEYLISYN